MQLSYTREGPGRHGPEKSQVTGRISGFHRPPFWELVQWAEKEAWNLADPSLNDIVGIWEDFSHVSGVQARAYSGSVLFMLIDLWGTR